jgi:squalene-hopene/tetraprenyl-beta-curcumene cyclase
MLDPSCEDITGRVLEALAVLGYDAGHPAATRAIDWLWSRQGGDGTWYGRWGVNYLYGTWLALAGLSAMGARADDERIQRAARWIREHQNRDGGWGELPASYDDAARKGRGPSTSAQTAWALIGLFAAGDYTSDAVERGLGYLVRTQQSDGSWTDAPWTGTGFPRVFYLRYHLYATQFPVLALALHARATAREAA